MSQEHNQMIDIVNVPIESLKDRYSENWNQHFPQALASLEGVRSVYTVYPKTELSDTVVQGQFLNVLDTNLFKSKQIAEIVELFKQGRIGNSTVFFFHDLWFQGIESLFYIRDALGINFKIAGMLHAGTWDYHDFLSHKQMGRWARKIEESWLNEIDLPIVSTHFHRSLIEGRRGPIKNLKVIPFPLWHLESLSPFKTKENIVVFPHRLADEKNPALFDELAKVLQNKLPDWKFIKTKDVCKTKEEYFALLERSRVAVSLATQETWGIAQLEATAAGCVPVVPDALSYSELYPSYLRYQTLTDAFNVPYHFYVPAVANKVIEVIEQFEEQDLAFLHEHATSVAAPHKFFEGLQRELKALS